MKGKCRDIFGSRPFGLLVAIEKAVNSLIVFYYSILLGIRTRDKLCVDEQDNAVDDRLCRHLIRFVKKRCRRKECPPR